MKRVSTTMRKTDDESNNGREEAEQRVEVLDGDLGGGEEEEERTSGEMDPIGKRGNYEEKNN